MVAKARRPASKRPRKPVAAKAPAKAKKPTVLAPTPPTEPPAAFYRGSRLSLPTDEPDGPLVDFGELFQVTNPRQLAFLAAVAASGRISASAKAAGVSQVATWKWRNDQSDTRFQEAFKVAQELGSDRMVSEAVRRAVDGYESPVYHQGKLIGTERKFSDSLLQALLKAFRRAEFGDKVEHLGAGGGPIQTQALDADKLTDAQIQQRIELLKRSLAEHVTKVVEQAVDEKVAAFDPSAAYEQALAKRNGNNGNG